MWELKCARGLNPEDRDTFAFDNIEELLRQFFWASPKFRKAIVEISDHLQVSHPDCKKVLVLFQYPHAAESFNKVLSKMGFHVIFLASDMDSNVRYSKIYKEFNDPTHRSEVLITSMSLNLLGFAMQETCHKLIVMEQPWSKAIEAAQSSGFVGTDKSSASWSCATQCHRGENFCKSRSCAKRMRTWSPSYSSTLKIMRLTFKSRSQTAPCSLCLSQCATMWCRGHWIWTRNRGREQSGRICLSWALG